MSPGRGTPKVAAPQPLDRHVRDRLRRQLTRDTAPELALRRELHARGLRYRVDRQILPGVRRRADLVFGPARVAVFVDGCFWHACPLHGAAPKNNADWWQAKLAGNVARDRDTDRRLQEAGWAVLRIWEHEPAQAAADRVATELARRRPRPAHSRGAEARDSPRQPLGPMVDQVNSRGH